MYSYGFCHLCVIPVRETFSDLSQMTTQLVFGDVFEVLDKKSNWLQIRNAFDDYIGWIDEKQQITISLNLFEYLNTPNFSNVNQGVIKCNNNSIAVIPGSSFPSEKSFSIDNYLFEHQIPLTPISKPDFKSISINAIKFLNSPYLWGGKSPYGIDCSGFTQCIYKISGIKLQRDAAQQAKQGRTLSFLNEAKSGDLLFFDNQEGIIVHVGIFLGENKIIHASGKVRIDLIDHQGIYNEETKSYSHKLRLIKSLIS